MEIWKAEMDMAEEICQILQMVIQTVYPKQLWRSSVITIAVCKPWTGFAATAYGRPSRTIGHGSLNLDYDVCLIHEIAEKKL